MLGILTTLPRWAYGLIAAAVCAAGFLFWLHFHDKGVIEEHERKVTAEVTEKTAKGNDAAHKAADETRRDITESNERARDAANRSDDPLREALRELGR